MLYTQIHRYMQITTLNYSTCSTNKHTAKLTKLHNIIAHAVHKNTQMYAHNYKILLHMLYTQTHCYMHTIA